MVKLLSEFAPAKINLFLRVVGRRSDGYHLLDSIFVPISLADLVTLELRPACARSVELAVYGAGAPTDASNLAWRAADAFLQDFRLDAAVRIGLVKRIPSGAGLGGGSSDAGAVLRMMAELTRVSDPVRLGQLALRLGADVPFFLNPRPARIGGIGERIETLQSFPALELVIAVPPVEVSTASVFQALGREGFDAPIGEADLSEILDGRISARHLVNSLEAVAVARYPAIGELKTKLETTGALGCAMSGSGGAVFALYESATQADLAAASMNGLAPWARVFRARSVPSSVAAQAQARSLGVMG